MEFSLVYELIVNFFLGGGGGGLDVDDDAWWFFFFCGIVALGVFSFRPSGHFKFSVLLPALLQVSIQMYSSVVPNHTI
jgi:hypothetical protein